MWDASRVVVVVLPLSTCNMYACNSGTCLLQSWEGKGKTYPSNTPMPIATSALPFDGSNTFGLLALQKDIYDTSFKLNWLENDKLWEYRDNMRGNGGVCSKVSKRGRAQRKASPNLMIRLPPGNSTAAFVASFKTPVPPPVLLCFSLHCCRCKWKMLANTLLLT